MILLAIIRNLLQVAIVVAKWFIFFVLLSQTLLSGSGRLPLRFANLQKVFLILFRKELINPVALGLDVSRQLLLEEDERMHLSEKLVTPWVFKLLPEVFALDLESLIFRL